MENTIKHAANKNGWHFLSKTEIEVKIPLQECEQLELGNEMQHALIQSIEMNEKKKSYTKTINSEIEERKQKANEAAHILHRGYRFETKPVMCYADMQSMQRIYIDNDTGEIVKEEPLRLEDRQMVLNTEQPEKHAEEQIDNEPDAELLRKAREIAEQTEHVSVSTFQRRLKIGYNKALKLKEQLTAEGIISSDENLTSGNQENNATPIAAQI